MKSLESESMRRTRWRCRRGLLELDILFKRFMDDHYSTLSSTEQADFDSLLTHTDTTLMVWLQGQQSPPSDLKSIFHKVIYQIDY